MKLFPFSFFSLLLLVPALPAAQMQPHQSILDSARQFIEQQHSGRAESLKVTPMRLDKRLRLKLCSKPLEGFSPGKKRSGKRQTVGVRCNDSAGWTIYVSLQVELSKRILVANRALSRGRTVQTGDLRAETRMVSGLHRGYIEDLAEAVGRTLKLSVRENAPLSPGQLKPLLEVTRGSQVTIVGRSGTIEVRMSGKAHANGVRGDRIKVTNNSSRRKIEATIVARNTVEVTL